MKKVADWFKARDWRPQSFQKECWNAYGEGKNGMLRPYRERKNLCALGRILQETLEQQQHPNGIQALWITPLKGIGRGNSTSHPAHDPGPLP